MIVARSELNNYFETLGLRYPPYTVLYFFDIDDVDRLNQIYIDVYTIDQRKFMVSDVYEDETYQIWCRVEECFIP